MYHYEGDMCVKLFRRWIMDLPKQLNDFMVSIGVDYAICGGYAIDLFIGVKTRPHKDLDVIVYWEDRDKIVQYMLDNGWGVYEPCKAPYLHKINDLSSQKLMQDNIWCIQQTNPHYKFTEHDKDMFAIDFDNSEQTELNYIEFLFNTRKDGYFLYKRNHDIKIKLNDIVFYANDIPCLIPEMVLLYKSTMAENPDYQLDFDNAIKEMTLAQRLWLKEALAVMFPDGHKWLNNL